MTNTSNTTYPSRPVLSIDAPEVQTFDASFIYRFFVFDERVDEQGNNIPRFDKEKEYIGIDDTSTDIIPRMVKMSWSSVVLEDTIDTKQTSRFKRPLIKKRGERFIQSNITKLYREEKFANYGYTGIELQDTGLDNKLYLIASGTIAKMVNSNNIEVARIVNKQLQSVSRAIDTNRISLLDASKFLAGEIGALDIPDQTIIDSLNDLRNANIRFYSTNQAKELIEDTFSKFKSIKTRVRINNKFINLMLTTSINDPLGFFADELAPLYKQAKKIQNISLKQYDATTIQENEYDIEVEPVSVRAAPNGIVFTPYKQHIGYIIEKYKRLSSGELFLMDEIIIESPSIQQIIDPRVAYGEIYVYQIRAVYLMEFQTLSEESNQILLSTIIFASAPSARKVVECIETIPPPPPADFDVVWDYNFNIPVVMWNFPNNQQRDIKKFQVFKRKTINDPFELQIEYDFDDSIKPTNSFETIDVNLVKKLTSPKTFYLDKDFNKYDTAIYTVCSVDAHGLTSNYTTQLKISFDRIKNKIQKQLISTAGAPKSYPNMYLNAETFVDVIKDSNRKKLKIFFDPEYLSISNKDKVESLFQTDKINGLYKLQFINVDFQQGDVVDIIINDLRKTKNIKFFAKNKMMRNKFYKG